MDGYVVIGTDLETKEFEKKIDKLKQKIDKKTKEKEKIKIDIEISEKKLLDYSKQMDVLDSRAGKYEEKIRNIQDRIQKGTAVAMDHVELENYLEKMQKIRDKGIQIEKNQDNINSKLMQQKIRYESITNDIENYKDQIELTNREIKSKELNDVRKSINSIGKEVNNVIKKLGKWTLAVFSIRSAYFLLRNSIATISQYNEQVAADIEYIRYAIAMVLEPIIVGIVQLVYKLLQYVGYLAKAWFNVDLFANASAKNMKKAGTEAKGLQKTLAGFDEMNVLNDNGSTGVLGAMPSMDLSKLDVETPEWLVKVKDIGQWIIDNWEEVVGALLLTKLFFDLLTGNWFGAIIDAIGFIILGINTIKKSLPPILQDILDISAEIIADTSVGTGLINKILKESYAHIKSVEQAEKDLAKTRKKLSKATNNYVEAIENEEETLKELRKVEKETGLSGEELYKLVEQGTLNYKELSPAQREVYKAYINHKNAEDDLIDSQKELNETKEQEIRDNLELQLSNAKTSESYDEYKKAVIDAYNSGKISAGEARNYISRAMADMSADSRATFIEDLPNDIKEGLNPTKYASWGERLKSWWNDLIRGLDTNIELTATAKGGGGSGSVGGGGGGGRAKGGIYYPEMPKLALGGIVNMPGPGVPYHGAVIGERGAEAVVPLTDSQQMELLGATIGRYITINANITNTMNGRIISRELQRVQNNSDFATNR